MEDGLSLEDLMAELDSVQAEETKHRLSERNCVEILQTLMSRGLLRGLMYTQDGKEYLTPKQLELEILAETEKEAEELLRKAIEFKPNFANYHSNLGNILKDLRKLDDAISSFQKALHIEKDNETSTIGFGTILIMKGEYREGLRQIKKGEGFIVFDNSKPTMKIYS